MRHIAGFRLQYPNTGDFNMPYIRQEVPREDFSVAAFARWEEGLVTVPGNPKAVRRIDDLCNRAVRFINRESGSGSRVPLDQLLKRVCLDSTKIKAYERAGTADRNVAHSVSIVLRWQQC